MTLADLPHELPDEVLLPAVADPEFDRMAALTRRVLDVPIAMVSLVDKRCQVFPGAVGLSAELDAARTNGLEYSYCQYVVRSAKPLIAADVREFDVLRDSPAVTELSAIAYAGMPLIDETGRPLGSLCVIDTEPRGWTQTEMELLADLAAACTSQLQLRAVNARTAISADRDRIGKELGQGVIRELFGLSMRLGSLRSQVGGPAVHELSTAIEAIDSVILRIRNSIFDVAR